MLTDEVEVVGVGARGQLAAGGQTDRQTAAARLQAGEKVEGATCSSLVLDAIITQQGDRVINRASDLVVLEVRLARGTAYQCRGNVCLTLFLENNTKVLTNNGTVPNIELPESNKKTRGFDYTIEEIFTLLNSGNPGEFWESNREDKSRALMNNGTRD
ncbi:hypothetical protein J6590_025698 [Homalodisca vitripennis]|nr:hypothetical protein J6590_025698 [Homalodisca vitripennis]